MSQTDPFVPDLVDMDLSPLYNKQFNVLVCHEDDDEYSCVSSFGPMSFEDMICTIKDIEPGRIRWRIVFVANFKDRTSEQLHRHTLTYIDHKADEILSEYLLIGHRDIDYDCKAEIVQDDTSKLFKQ